MGALLTNKECQDSISRLWEEHYKLEHTRENELKKLATINVVTSIETNLKTIDDIKNLQENIEVKIKELGGMEVERRTEQ